MLLRFESKAWFGILQSSVLITCPSDLCSVCVQDELLVVKDKVVLEIVDLVKWVGADSDVDSDALSQLLYATGTDCDTHGLGLIYKMSYDNLRIILR